MSLLTKRLFTLFSKSSSQFIVLSNNTLEHLSTELDAIEETHNIDYSLKDGVLNISTANNKVVINRQIPNQQIWYSSMKSGPQRFNYIEGEWINGNGVKLLDMMMKDVGKQ